MGIETYQGIVENGQIKFTVNVKLPENKKVYVIIPDEEEKPKFDLAKMAAEMPEDYQPGEEDFGKPVGKGSLVMAKYIPEKGYMRKLFDTPTKISPEQFEIEIQNQIRVLGIGLQDFNVKRRERISGSDGEYEIDVLARFEAFGANFIVLIECKHHKNPIKREVVQVLNDRLRSVGAQKAMIFSTAGFQSGAIEYAQKNGIALIKVEDGRNSYFVRDFQGEIDYPDWLPDYDFWLVSLSENGHESYSKIHERNPEKLLKLFEAEM